MDKLLRKEIYLPIIYILIGYLIYKILSKVVIATLNKKQKDFPKSSYNYKKIETFKNLLINLLRIIVFVFVVLSVLPVFGINVASLIAGLGVASAVFALAFQDTLKDFISGVSIILENHFSLGDTVEIAGFRGEVIAMGLKSTRLRSFSGEVKIIANRNISEVINYNMSHSLAIVDIAVSYETDNEKVEKILKNLAEELSNTLPNLKGKVEVLGIQDLSDSFVKYRITAKTECLEHYGIQREILKQVKLRLEKEKIKIPYPQIEVHHGE